MIYINYFKLVLYKLYINYWFLIVSRLRQLFSQCVVDSLNIFSVEDRFDRRVFIEAGICLMIFRW